MHILIVSDAWFPQINGVVQTLVKTSEGLRARGHVVSMITPDQFRTWPMPSYPEIRLALARTSRVGKMIEAVAPDAVHIATEGPLGLAARRHCVRRKRCFTTSYHTRFPDYLRARLNFAGVERAGYGFMRWFHAPAQAVMAGTPSVARDLEAHGFANVRLWTRGVDHTLFHPGRRIQLDLPGPIALYVGRVAVEKGIEAFLSLDFKGTKMVVGDGPALARLKAQHPDAVFTGYRRGEALAEIMASADVFVFPSRTDTFGLVMLEAMASGLPVAAFPVTGPIDIVEDGVSGALDEDLGQAITRALTCRRTDARLRALEFSWDRTAEIFAAHVADASRSGIRH
ncbi:glycosyltransferase involved in cell wall biosynthesis [Rhodoligotrophos appendicifer]|uniref:glycosyltransferase family 4 protein n=1 Tax=Rhodoligotrophos appendicifer TaxID=987056 RepID=UPI0011865E1F|nr:glycosyltransferase family 1 protein [Rhodoligotrophos appendicifer]